MAEQRWFAGVDWPWHARQASLLDGEGVERGNEVFAHSGTGLTSYGDQDAARALVESLLARGFAVYSINPRQLLRDRFSPAGPRTTAATCAGAGLGAGSDRDCPHRVRASDRSPSSCASGRAASTNS